MTVAELIEALSECNQDDLMAIHTNCHGCDCLQLTVKPGPGGLVWIDGVEV